MGSIQLLMHGFFTLFTFNNVGAVLLRAVLGLVVGTIPGIGSLAGVALLLPLTYKFSPTTAIIMLEALYYSNMYGDAFSAVLSNILGDSPAICVTMNDYPMASRKERPGQALFTTNMASFVGGTIGIIILTSAGPTLANIGLRFGSSEVAAPPLIAMTSISWLVGGNPIKGVVITIPGILLASIGIDTLLGSPRYGFGSICLLGGIPFTPFTIGTVGSPQVIRLVMGRDNGVKSEPHMKLTIRGGLLTKHDLKHLLPPALRSDVVGTFVGMLPGAGAVTGAFMSCAAQEKFKDEKELGAGATEDIAAGGAADNVTTADAFAPLSALDIPGSGTGTVLLGGLIVWGLDPGPLLFTNEPEFTWGLIASLFLSNIFVLAVAIGVIPFLTQILSIPVKYIIPVITIICVVGSYSFNYSVYGVLIMFLLGILGYLLVENDYPTAPILLFFVLTELLKSNMRKASTIPRGSLSIFLARPITCVLVLIFLAFIYTPVVKAILKKAREE